MEFMGWIRISELGNIANVTKFYDWGPEVQKFFLLKLIGALQQPARHCDLVFECGTKVTVSCFCHAMDEVEDLVSYW